MYHVLIAAFATCVACELFETEKIYATDDYAIAKRRIEHARERIAVAEAQVREKGDRKSARLEQAQVALVHAEQKMKRMCMATGRTFTIVTCIGAAAVRWYYSHAEQTDWVATAVRRAGALGARDRGRRTRFKSHRGVFHRDVSLARGVRGCAGA